jgi:ketosteroid isomerase-like protein
MTFDSASSEIDKIRQLKSRYFRCLDAKDWSSLTTVFSADAIFDARLATSIAVAGAEAPAGDPTWYAEGCADIAAFIRRVVEHTVTAHHGHDHEVEILSDTAARGIVALEDWIWESAGNGGKLILHGWGHYHEEYRREPDGWKIVRSTLTRLNLVTG